MKRILKFTVLLLLVFCSCKKQVDEFANITSNGLVATISPYYTDDESKVSISEDLSSFTWNDNDEIGLYYKSEDIEANAKYCIVTGGLKTGNFRNTAFALKSNTTYYSFYPYSPDISKDSAYVDYTNQIQKGNGETTHIGKFNYMYSTVCVDEIGDAEIVFKNLSAVIQFRLKLPKGTYSSLVVTSDNEKFISTGYVDMETGIVTPILKDSKASIQLGEDGLSIKNDTILTVNMLVAPVDLSNSNLTIELSSNGSVYYNEVSGKNMKSGKAYGYDILEFRNNTTINGTWHLGIFRSGSNCIKFDGTEKMIFSGNYMEWTGRQDGGDSYDLEYSENAKSFTAISRTSGYVEHFEIKTYTDELLVLYNSDGATRYFYNSKEAAQNAVYIKDDPNHTVSSNINEIVKYADGHTKSSITPMGVHYENAHKTTNSDKEWLADASKEPSPIAGLNNLVSYQVTLYPFGDPEPADINQHAIGDCCAMSVFASFAYLYPDFIKSIITDNQNETYTVKMYDPDGNSINVSVSNKILCDSNGNIGQVTGKNNVVNWATIMEKAMIKWEECYNVNSVEGIGTEFVVPLFTGCGESFSFPANSLYSSELKIAIDWALNNGNITVGGFDQGGLKCGSLESIRYHAFTFMFSTQSTSLFAMRNPWGITSVDGVLEIPDKREITQSIDARIVMPGAASSYKKSELGPYTPPSFTALPTDLGVSERLINKTYLLNK